MFHTSQELQRRPKTWDMGLYSTHCLQEQNDERRGGTETPSSELHWLCCTTIRIYEGCYATCCHVNEKQE